VSQSTVNLGRNVSKYDNTPLERIYYRTMWQSEDRFPFEPHGITRILSLSRL